VSTALTRFEEQPERGAIQRSGDVDFGNLMALATQLVPTGMLPEHIKTPGQALAIILTGRELGMAPMRALRSLAMVKGKVVESADSQLARFKADGGRAQFRTLTEREAVLWLRHPNGDEHVEPFTFEDAERAGLTKPGRSGEPSMYTKYPRAMLRSRAITAGLKSLGWEGGVGAYDPEEISVSAQYTEPLADESEPSTSGHTVTLNGAAVMPFGPDEVRGVPITDERISADLLVSAIDWIAKDSERTQKFAQFSAQATALLPEKLRAAPTEKLEKIGRWANKEERIAEYQWLIDLVEAEWLRRNGGAEMAELEKQVHTLLTHPACFALKAGIEAQMGEGMTDHQLRTTIATLESQIAARTKGGSAKQGAKTPQSMGDTSIPGATNA
jgi:hypothetical protein